MKEDKIPEKDSSQEIPEWLKTIQLNSWEAELLVSALVLYALFQLPDLITAYSLRHFSSGSMFHVFFNILNDAIGLLKVGYALHIVVRGLWVASVGLSYVFPDGINNDRLKFKGKFAKELDSSKSVGNVLRLEKLSSIIYGVSFLLFGAMLGMGMMIFIVIVATELMNANKADYLFAYIVFIFFYFIIVVLLLIDFLTNGLFRRIEWMAKWFYPVAVFFRIITLSFLYRRSLLVLTSNTKGWKSYLIPCAVASVCCVSFYLDGKIGDARLDTFLKTAQQPSAMNNYYEDQRKEDDRLLATIQTDIVNENALRLFIKNSSFLSRPYKSDTTKSDTEWGALDSDSTSLFINKWLVVRVDSTKIDDIRWFNTQHPVTSNFGFYAYIDISQFNRGDHNLSIELDDSKMGFPAKRNIKGKYYRKYLSNIYFFYDKQ